MWAALWSSWSPSRTIQALQLSALTVRSLSLSPNPKWHPFPKWLKPRGLFVTFVSGRVRFYLKIEAWKHRVGKCNWPERNGNILNNHLGSSLGLSDYFKKHSKKSGLSQESHDGKKKKKKKMERTLGGSQRENSSSKEASHFCISPAFDLSLNLLSGLQR